MFGESDFGNDSIKYHRKDKKKKHDISSVGRHLTKALIESHLEKCASHWRIACWAHCLFHRNVCAAAIERQSTIDFYENYETIFVRKLLESPGTILYEK